VLPSATKLNQFPPQEVMALGLPQWLPLTDAEAMIATHLAAEKSALAGGRRDLFRPTPAHSLNGNGKIPTPELELDLDCWQVSNK
jgi:hypothetical protein